MTASKSNVNSAALKFELILAVNIPSHFCHITIWRLLVAESLFVVWTIASSPLGTLCVLSLLLAPAPNCVLLVAPAPACRLAKEKIMNKCQCCKH